MLKHFSTLAEPIEKYLSQSTDLIAPSSIHALLAANQKSPLLLITTSTRASDLLTAELKSLADPGSVVNFPAWETLPHERLSPKADTVTERFKVLNKLNGNNIKFVVCSIRALMQPIIVNSLENSQVNIKVGNHYLMTDLTQKLVTFGFTRSDLVERRGDFAVRGGILDLFLADQEHPIRIDFFGDEIEDISYFAIADQRSLNKVTEEITIYPCRELLIDDQLKKKALKLGKDFPQISELTEKIVQGINFEGMESLAAGLVDEFKNIIDFLPNGSQIWIIDEPRVRTRAADLVTTNDEFLSAAWSNLAWVDDKEIDAPIELSKQLGRGGFYELEKVIDIADEYGYQIRNLKLYASNPDEKAIEFIEHIDSYTNKYDDAILDIKNWHKSGFKVIFTAPAVGTLKRFSELLNSSDLPNETIQTSGVADKSNLITLLKSDLQYGFISERFKLVVITDKDISGQRSLDKDQARMPSRRKKAIDPLQLKAGDYVVHEQHGVGRYSELINRTIGGISREYLVIEYASSKRGQPADRLFVPTDTLEQVTKYVGGEAPALHRIGGADWQNSKRKARKAVKQIAAELIRLYAARMSAPGFAFSQDTPWQKELEESFAFIETIDQQATIDEVKRDMEKPSPMDRIVCGDVGYGKTEIAVRAAFKAVQDGKQVAILVPTTLLVQQHFNTFSNRYSGFPVKLAALSRFNTPSEGKEIIAGLKSGAVDVVIGTHRLLSKDIEFAEPWYLRGLFEYRMQERL